MNVDDLLKDESGKIVGVRVKDQAPEGDGRPEKPTEE